MNIVFTDIISIIGLFLMLISWLVSFRSSLQAAIRKWTWRTLYHAFKDGKRRHDLLVKLFGTLGIIALLAALLIEITPNAIGMEAHAATHDIALASTGLQDPEWCKHGPNGCTDYWKAQLAQSKQPDTWTGAAVAITKQLKDQPDILKDLIVGGSLLLAFKWLCTLLTMVSKDIKEFKIAQLSHLKGNQNG